MTPTPPIDPIAFSIGNFSIHWYAIIIVSAIVVAEWMIRHELVRQGYSDELAFDLLFPGLIVGGIGARLYYVIFSWEYYQTHLIEIPAVWQGGLAIYGFVLGLVLTIGYLCRRWHYSFLTILDVFAPAVLVAQAIGRWGNFINQEAHGAVIAREALSRWHLPVWLIEQMQINGQYYQPTFLYESIWSCIGVILLLVIRRQPRLAYQGEIAAGYAIWYGLGRMFIEGMRMDSLYLGGYRVSQWLSLLLVVLGVLFIIYRRRQQTPPVYYMNDRKG